jgi:DNA-directed RNA polymerase subunit F
MCVTDAVSANIDIIKLQRFKGLFDLIDTMEHAISTDKYDVVEYIIDHCNPDADPDWIDWLYQANQDTLGRKLVMLEADIEVSFDIAMEHGDLTLAKQLWPKMDPDARSNEFSDICTDDTLDFAKWFHEVANIEPDDYSWAFYEAMMYGDHKAAKWLYSVAPADIDDIEVILEKNGKDLAWLTP